MNKYLLGAALAAVMTFPLTARADDQFGLNVSQDGISLNYASTSAEDPAPNPEDRWQRGRAGSDSAQVQPQPDESLRGRERHRHEFRVEERRRHAAAGDRRWEARHDREGMARDGWRDHARQDGFRPEGMAREEHNWQPRHQLASAPSGFSPSQHVSQALHQGFRNAGYRLPAAMRSHQAGHGFSHHVAGAAHRHQT